MDNALRLVKPASKYYLIRSHGLGHLYAAWRQRLSGKFEIELRLCEGTIIDYEIFSTKGTLSFNLFN